MRIIESIAALALSFQVLIPWAHASDVPLVSISVADAPAENGKKLNATLREVVREREFSIVEVDVASGGSVSTSIFILRGACLVLRARGERFFASKPEHGRAMRAFRLTFPTEATPEQLSGRTKSVFSAQECDLLGFK